MKRTLIYRASSSDRAIFLLRSVAFVTAGDRSQQFDLMQGFTGWRSLFLSPILEDREPFDASDRK